MRSQLMTSYPLASAALPNSTQTATLHQLDFYLLLNHPSGFFARFDARGFVPGELQFRDARRQFRAV